MLNSKILARVALIASIYVTTNIIFAPISYGPIQVRVAEALTVLPFIDPAAILGLFLGCILSNILGGIGLVDILGGSFCTLVAAVLTYRMRKPYFAPLPPVLINAAGVSMYLHILFELPYWLTVIYIGFGELIACYVIGYPLLLVLMKRNIWVYHKH